VSTAPAGNAAPMVSTPAKTANSIFLFVIEVIDLNVKQDTAPLWKTKHKQVS
jgi:hypothetical protein